METLPNLIVNYLNDPYLYDKIIDQHKLSYLCLVKLLDIYLPPRKDFTIEEIIDYSEEGSIILSYLLLKRLACQLNILQLPELFEPLVLIFDRQLKDYINRCINILIKLNIIDSCIICGKHLLISFEYYYYRCEHCNDNKYYQNQDNFFCEQCQNPVTYYLIIDQYNFKLVATSYQALDYYQGINYNWYGADVYCCNLKCDDNHITRVYQKYNNQ